MALELCGWLLPLLQQAQVIIAFNKNSCPFVFTWQTKWNCACLMRVGHSSHSYFFAGWRNHSHNLLFTTTTTSVLWLFKRVFIVRTQKNNLRVPRTSFPSLFFLVTYAPALLFSTFPIFSLLALSYALPTWTRLFFSQEKAKPTLYETCFDKRGIFSHKPSGEVVDFFLLQGA